MVRDGKVFCQTHRVDEKVRSREDVDGCHCQCQKHTKLQNGCDLIISRGNGGHTGSENLSSNSPPNSCRSVIELDREQDNDTCE